MKFKTKKSRVNNAAKNNQRKGIQMIRDLFITI